MPVAPPPHGAMRALVSLFYSCEASAREHEAHTDQIIDRDLDQTARRQRPAKEDGGGKEDDLEETVARRELGVFTFISRNKICYELDNRPVNNITI